MHAACATQVGLEQALALVRLADTLAEKLMKTKGTFKTTCLTQIKSHLKYNYVHSLVAKKPFSRRTKFWVEKVIPAVCSHPQLPSHFWRSSDVLYTKFVLCNRN